MALDLVEKSPNGEQTRAGVASAGRVHNQALVVLPTYNERENLSAIVASILELGHDVLIIDDNSPDGTGQLADDIASRHEQVEVIHRATKLGLGSAYVLGFKRALDQGYEFVVEMDADGSHQTSDLEALIARVKTAPGLAIGSRYVLGGGTTDRAVHRRLLTRMGNLHCRLMLGGELRDWTSGFRCYSTQALERVGLDGIISDGFSFQIEMAHRFARAGMQVREVPIRFKERTAGRSKASMHEVMEALRCVTVLRLRRRISNGRRVLERGVETTTPRSPTTPEVVDKPARPAQTHPLNTAVVGVLAHNEEATIETCLRALLAEPLVKSVVVVASGCTDRTEKVAGQISAQDHRVRVISEPKRSGKAAAINLLLRATSEPIVVVVAGDVVFTHGSLGRLVEPFTDASVGMTGCRPIPTNPRSGIVGNAVNLLWDLHHEVSLINPKMGEAVAFRRVLTSIDDHTLVDEASMEKVIRDNDLVLRYVPDAVVRNHGPETIREFIAQRSRVCRGHLALRSDTGYQVSSMSTINAARATWSVLRDEMRPFPYVLTTLALEAVARTHAYSLHVTGRRPSDGTWKPILTSKRVVGDGHVLRAHHDEYQTLLLPYINGGRHDPPALTAFVRKRVRRDDRLAMLPEALRITFRGNEHGKRSVLGRLELVLAAGTDGAQANGASPADSSAPAPERQESDSTA